MPKIREVTILPLGLRAWREERKWSQKDLAERADVSATLIALIETGDRQPSLRNALAIAKAIGVDVRALGVVHVSTPELTGTPEPTQAAS